MSRVMQTLSLASATAVLIAVSTPAAAQPPKPASSATAQSQPANAQSAGQALVDARKALNAVLNTPAPNQEAFEKLNEIKSHYLELEKAYSSRGDWQTHYTAILQRVSELTDSASATGTSSTSTATTGATGTSGTAAPAKLDAAAMNNLQAFRKALVDFGTAMGGAPAGSATMSASGTVSTTGSGTQVTAATGTSGTGTTVTATGTTGSTSTTASATTPPTTTTQTTTVQTTTTGASVDQQFTELNQLLAQAMASTATAAGADTICIDRKALQDIQQRIAQLQQAVKKP